MSDDQLGWEQILKGTAPAEASPDNAKDAASSAMVPDVAKVASPEPSLALGEPVFTEQPAPEPERPEQPERKRKPRAPAEQPSPKSDDTTSYAKKNWGALNFGSGTPAKDAPTVQVKAPAKEPATSQPLRMSAPTVSTTVTTTVIKETIKVEVPVIPPAETKAPGGEPDVISVSDLNRHIRDILEGRFPLLWLKAEISNFKAHTSGHFYFSLKDAKAQISAVMFRGFNAQLKFRPEDGMEVLVRGKITVYEPRGNYQIFCELMEPVGAGALQRAYEQLKAKLAKEGLFDPAKKRKLPALPQHIAIVTSPTGAAIRDMLNVLRRRFKGARITVIPCKVQGDQAPGEIVASIALANRLPDVDVMIIGRGGGSIEDLWAFNDERVARAIAGSKIPTISAVGHEVDFTIADFVADLRAPTPSAAAELVVKNAADLQQRVAILARQLKLMIARQISSTRQGLLATSRRLIDPQRRLQDAAIRCDELMQRLQSSVTRGFQDRRVAIELLGQRMGTPQTRIVHDREVIKGLSFRLKAGVQGVHLRKRELLTRNMAVLDSLSPLRVLDRGFSMVVRQEKIITHAKDLGIGDRITVRMCQGSIEAQVVAVEGDKR